jgi:hypothetical protein
MKARLQVTKHGATLHSGVYDIADADGFGRACVSIWSALREQQLNQETSIGALMENLDRSVLDQLSGAQITLAAVE